MLGNIWCKFVSYGITGGLPSNVTATEIHYGIFLRGEHIINSNGDLWEACSSYPDYYDQYMDARWTTSKAFTIIAAIAGAFAVFFGFWASCLSPRENAWKIIGPIFVLICLFQGLTLLFLSSNACNGELMNKKIEEDYGITFDDSCSLSTGANMCIASTALYFAAGVAGCCVSAASSSLDADEKAEGDESAVERAGSENAIEKDLEEKQENEEAPGVAGSDTPISVEKD